MGRRGWGGAAGGARGGRGGARGARGELAGLRGLGRGAGPPFSRSGSRVLRPRSAPPGSPEAGHTQGAPEAAAAAVLGREDPPGARGWGGSAAAARRRHTPGPAGDGKSECAGRPAGKAGGEVLTAPRSLSRRHRGRPPGPARDSDRFLPPLPPCLFVSIDLSSCSFKQIQSVSIN